MQLSPSCLFGLALSATLAAQTPRYTIFGDGCVGSMPKSRLSLVIPPAIGSTLTVEITNLPANLGFMMTGFSNTASPFGPLPLTLAPFGMGPCVAYVSPDATMLVLGSLNRATYTLQLPVIPSLVGGTGLWSWS